MVYEAHKNEEGYAAKLSEIIMRMSSSPDSYLFRKCLPEIPVANLKDLRQTGNKHCFMIYLYYLWPTLSLETKKLYISFLENDICDRWINTFGQDVRLFLDPNGNAGLINLVKIYKNDLKSLTVLKFMALYVVAFVDNPEELVNFVRECNRYIWPIIEVFTAVSQYRQFSKSKIIYEACSGVIPRNQLFDAAIVSECPLVLEMILKDDQKKTKMCPVQLFYRIYNYHVVMCGKNDDQYCQRFKRMFSVNLYDNYTELFNVFPIWSRLVLQRHGIINDPLCRGLVFMDHNMKLVQDQGILADIVFEFYDAKL